MSLRRLKVTRCNILGENLHIKIERGKDQNLWEYYISAEAGKHANKRGNRNYRDKGPKGSTDRGKNNSRYLKDLLKVKVLKTFRRAQKE